MQVMSLFTILLAKTSIKYKFTNIWGTLRSEISQIE